MAGTCKFTFVNYTGESDNEARVSLPTIRQHVMHDFLRRQKEADNDDQEQLPKVAWLDTSAENTGTPLSPRPNSTAAPRLPFHADSGFYNEHSTKFFVNFHEPYCSDKQTETVMTPHVEQADSAVGLDLLSWHDHPHSDTVEVSNISLAPTRHARGAQRPRSFVDRFMAPESRDSGIDIGQIDSDDEASQKHERSVSPSDTGSGRSWSLSNTGPMLSSGRPMDSLDDLDNHSLDTETAKFRSWLLTRSKSALFLQHLQRQVVDRCHDSSMPQDQSADSSSKSASNSSSTSPSTSSSIPTTLSGGNSSGSKRRRDNPGENDERLKKKRRVPDHKDQSTPSSRLACFYNKYDPMMYRSNAQTERRFEVCGTHGFENMNRL
jgi:hypothetical protein